MERIIIFDTTLRDGEQSARAALAAEEKLEIARQLDKLNVDIIEAGFPRGSEGELETVRSISREIRRPVICALAHAQSQAVDAAWEGVKEAEHPRIHVFLSSSDIHISKQLRKTREEVLELCREMVGRAKGYCEDVEFSPMDATRTAPDFLCHILETAIEAGATTVNIPDTVGYTMPQEFGRLIDHLFANVSNIHRAVVSVHCHDDLGLAVANSLAVLGHGIRQIECTINGIGERAGNASLEEIVMALKTRQDLLQYTTDINTTQLYSTSRLVSELTGMPVQPNKAIVGANAFRHESGIHQDGILKERLTYEIIEPESVGFPGTALTLGKLSGRHALRKHLEELGYQLTEEELSRAFLAFKELADKKKEITDRDLEALVAEELRTVSETYHLERVQVSCGDPGIPTATVSLRDPEGQELTEVALGTGPVDAVYKAVDKIINVPCHLIEFSVKSVTGGIDAIGEVLVRLESGGKIFTGRGASTDIIVSSAKAYVNALNRLLTK